MKGVSTNVQAEVLGQPQVFIPPEPFRMLPFKTGSPTESEVELNSMGWAMSSRNPPVSTLPPTPNAKVTITLLLSVGTKDTYHIFMFSQQGLYRQRHFLRPCFVFKA